MEKKNANEPDQWYDDSVWCHGVCPRGGPNWVVRDK